MLPKVFMNDSVYNVFAVRISGVAKACFPNGFLGILDALFGRNVGNVHHFICPLAGQISSELLVLVHDLEAPSGRNRIFNT